MYIRRLIILFTSKDKNYRLHQKNLDVIKSIELEQNQF